MVSDIAVPVKGECWICGKPAAFGSDAEPCELWCRGHAPHAVLLAAYDEQKGQREMSDECIGLMRIHLEAVGIHCTFADDCAAMAARQIIEAEAYILDLARKLAEARALATARAVDVIAVLARELAAAREELDFIYDEQEADDG